MRGGREKRKEERERLAWRKCWTKKKVREPLERRAMGDVEWGGRTGETMAHSWNVWEKLYFGITHGASAGASFSGAAAGPSSSRGAQQTREGRRRAQQSQKTHDDDEKFHLIFFLFFSLSCVSLAKFFRIVLFCFVLFFSLPRDSRVFFFSSPPNPKVKCRHILDILTRPLSSCSPPVPHFNHFRFFISFSRSFVWYFMT